jgi:hypothetical protein
MESHRGELITQNAPTEQLIILFCDFYKQSTPTGIFNILNKISSSPRNFRLIHTQFIIH